MQATFNVNRGCTENLSKFGIEELVVVEVEVNIHEV